MIALSLAEGISDIAAGKVALVDVDVIISCTQVPHQESWEEVVRKYRKNFWKGDYRGRVITPDACEKIFYQLLRAGKIIQPAVTEKRLPARGGGWVESLEGLKWNPIQE